MRQMRLDERMANRDRTEELQLQNMRNNNAQRLQEMQNRGAADRLDGQLGLERDRMRQQGRQFDAGLGLDRDKLEQQQNQFDISTRLDRDRLNQQQNQFDATNQTDRQRMMLDSLARLNNTYNDPYTLSKSPEELRDMLSQLTQGMGLNPSK